MPHRVFLFIIALVVTLVIGLQTFVVLAENASSPGLRFVACPSKDVLANMVGASSDGRVLVFWEDRALIKCFEDFLDATNGHELNASVIARSQYYRSLLAENIRRLLSTAYKGSAITSDVERYGFNVFKVEVYSGNIVGVVIETSKPGGLGDEFAAVVARAVAETLGIRSGTIFVMYTAPNLMSLVEQLAANMDNIIEQVVRGEATIAIGSLGYLPAVTVDTRAASLVGGVQKLADIVAKSLPENGWALLILREEPLRFYPQPGKLPATSTDTTSTTRATTSKEATSTTSTAPASVTEPSDKARAATAKTTTNIANKQPITPPSTATSMPQSKNPAVSTVNSSISAQNNGSQSRLIAAILVIVLVVAVTAALLRRR